MTHQDFWREPSLVLDERFCLRYVVGVDGEGRPNFGDASETVALCRLSADDIGRWAVCKAFADAKHRLVVFGTLADGELDASQQGSGSRERFTLQVGRSSLTMNANGSIELVGDDVLLRSRGHMDIRGAYIDLN